MLIGETMGGNHLPRSRAEAEIGIPVLTDVPLPSPTRRKNDPTFEEGFELRRQLRLRSHQGSEPNQESASSLQQDSLVESTRDRGCAWWRGVSRPSASSEGLQPQ